MWLVLLWIISTVLGAILRGSGKGLKMGMIMGIATGLFSALFLSIAIPLIGNNPPSFILQLNDLGVISLDPTFDAYDFGGCLLFGLILSIITMFGGSIGGTIRPE